MQQSRFLIFSLLLFFLMFISCDTQDPFSIPPPDFSSVPEPYDISNVESIEIGSGIKTYIHDEGYGPFSITAIDVVNIYLTLRTEDGEIVYSTFSDDRTSPATLSMRNADGSNPALHRNIFQANTITVAYTPGLKRGLLGMQNGEKRTFVISPEKGFKNIPANNVNVPYRDETLIYDVMISNIGPTKSP